MSCDRYLELISARLDGALTEAEARELEAHLESCPACRAAGAQLAALQSAFPELEEIPAPEGFVRDVTDRVRGLEPNRAVPRFRRPRFKALAVLAACAVLAVGLYSAVCPPQQDADQMTRGFRRDALEEAGDVSDFADLQAAPGFSTAAAGPDTDTPAEGTDRCMLDRTKAVPDEAVAYDDTAALSAAPMSGAEVLVVDRMPEGGWELIPPETPVSGDGLHVTGELLVQIGQMAQDQGITACLTSGTEEAEQHLIVVLAETE